MNIWHIRKAGQKFTTHCGIVGGAKKPKPTSSARPCKRCFALWAASRSTAFKSNYGRLLTVDREDRQPELPHVHEEVARCL